MALKSSELLRLAEHHGTPFYVYELDRVRERAADLCAALPAGARALYSLKANPLPPLVACLRSAGCAAEVSSIGELDAAVAAGCDPGGVLYTGPGKADREIGDAVARGAGLFSCESAVELSRLGAVAAVAGRELRVLLRLQPREGATSGLSMADGRQFGFDAADAAAAWREVGEGLRLEGFHVYLGSQLGTVDHLLDGFAQAKRVVDEVTAAVGEAPRVVDLGGGFPWPYATEGTGCDLTGLREGLDDLLADWTHAPEVWFESGRRLVASSGSLLTTVVDVKERAGGVVVVVDGGINVLGGMSGLGRVLRLSTTLENLSADEDRETLTADVVGPLCTPLDRVAARTPLRAPRVGDVLRVANVGAYGATASLTSFLSRPGPLELVVDGDAVVSAWQIDGRASALPLLDHGSAELSGSRDSATTMTRPLTAP